MKPEAWANSYPVLLRDAGYYTDYVGKNHVPIGNEGYDSNLIDQSFDFWYAAHGHLTFYPKQRHEIFKHAQADTQTEVVGEGAASFLSSDKDYIEGAEAFLERRPDGKPFCLSIVLNLPHGAGTRSMKLRPDDPELYRTTYRDRMDQLSIPKTYVAKNQIVQPKLPADLLFAQHRQTNYDYVDTPELLREQLVRKAQTITGIDAMVGQIRESLADQGLADDTVIVFSSDHGIMAGEFGLGGKSLNYESCLRVPMIVMDPRVETSNRGRRTMALVESVDIAPTLLDLAGVSVPTTMQGKSLRGLIDGNATKVRDSSFAENLWSTYFGNPRIESVRTSDWKYIRYFENDRSRFADITKETMYEVTPNQVANYADWLTSSISGEQPVYEELFHLESDPSESVNLANRPLYAEKLRELQAECQRLVTFAKGDLDEPPATLIVDGIREGKSKPTKAKTESSSTDGWKLAFKDDYQDRTEIGEDYTTTRGHEDAWSVVDGVLIGKQTNDDHGAVIRTELDFDDIDIQFDFRFSGGRSFNFVIDDKNDKSVHAGHICRVSVFAKSLRIGDDKTGSMNLDVREKRKDKNLSDADAQAIEQLLASTQSSVKASIEPGEWHTLRIRIQGDIMKAFLDGELATSLRSPGFAHPRKTKLGFTVNGATIDFDNLKVMKTAEATQ